MIIPPCLKKGDSIAVVSPSSPVQAKQIQPGIEFLKANGFNINYGKHVYSQERFLAGTDIERATDIMDAFKNPEIKAIIATRGGQGSQRILPLLDYDFIQKNPKPLFGFSDTTALQLGLFKKAGLVSYTGFTLSICQSNQIKKTLLNTLLGKPYEISSGIKVNSGTCQGPLLGGNLTLLTNLMGTQYFPNFKNCILLIEDVAVEPYNIDGMLSQLHLAGIFNEVIGVVFGKFEQCNFNTKHKHQGNIYDVIDEWASIIKVPCIKEFSYGHGKKNAVLPIGKDVILDADNRCIKI